MRNWGGGVEISRWFSVQRQWQCGQSQSNNRHKEKSHTTYNYDNYILNMIFHIAM